MKCDYGALFMGHYYWNNFILDGLTSFFKDFLMWTIFKIFIEFVTIWLLFYVLVYWPWVMWDLSSPTKDQTHTLCIWRPSCNHWTTREVSELLKLRMGFHYLRQSQLRSWQTWYSPSSNLIMFQ